MKVIFYATINKSNEALAALDFGRGVTNVGDDFAIHNGSEYNGVEADLAVVMGVKGHSRMIFDDYVESGKHAVLVDKAYNRRPLLHDGLYRFTLDDFQPTKYLTAEYEPGRWTGTGGESVPQPRFSSRAKSFGKGPPASVIFCGSSQKFCNWHGLGNATDYARKIITEIRGRFPDVPIIYRPKPSWAAGHPEEVLHIEGTTFSGPTDKFAFVLPRVGGLVTYGSNASLEALLYGVPVVTLGPSAVDPLCPKTIPELFSGLPHWNSVRRHCDALAHWQYTAREMSDGTCWKFLKGWL